MRAFCFGSIYSLVLHWKHMWASKGPCCFRATIFIVMYEPAVCWDEQFLWMNAPILFNFTLTSSRSLQLHNGYSCSERARKCERMCTRVVGVALVLPTLFCRCVEKYRYCAGTNHSGLSVQSSSRKCPCIFGRYRACRTTFPSKTVQCGFLKKNAGMKSYDMIPSISLPPEVTFCNWVWLVCVALC